MQISFSIFGKEIWSLTVFKDADLLSVALGGLLERAQDEDTDDEGEESDYGFRPPR